MLWNGRVYFLSDRDGTMNLWSMAEGGGDLTQHTRHSGFDVASPSLSDGRIVYQLGADLRLFDIASGQDARSPIKLVSDFDQLRERWVKTPMEWVTERARVADRRPRRAHGARAGVRRPGAAGTHRRSDARQEGARTARDASSPTASRC